MAKTLFIFTIQLLIFLILCPFSLISISAEDDFVRQIDRKLLGLKKEKLSHFRFYWHDIESGRQPTSVPAVRPLGNSTTAFGLLNIHDNPLTLGPELGSKLVGKAQGFYVSASQSEVSLLMGQNFAFLDGKYKGSSLTVLGRNPIFNKVREMPVVGGSGLFRLARGFVEARTHWVSNKTRDAIVQYNVYVLHY